MKKYFQRMVLVAMAVATAQVAVAESWRINNDVSKGAHFASINEAMDTIAVADGDTLYLDPGCVLSDAQTITKAVTVIGTGWGYSHLPYMPARITNVFNINNAAKMVGVQITNEVCLGCPNIILDRCYTGSIRKQWGADVSNLLVTGCYVSGFLGGTNYNYNITGCKIYNSIIVNSDYAVRWMYDTEIVNCFILSTASAAPFRQVYNSLIKNNIILCTFSAYYQNRIFDDCTNNTISNNVFSADETSEDIAAYVEENKCANSATITDYIVNTGAGGAAYQLCEGSPAKGFGENGIDCGPYAEGSPFPFVTYGMPQYVHYPATMVVPTRPTDDKVSVKLKIVNQDK